jgi:dihydroorotate dehydrogenase
MLTVLFYPTSSYIRAFLGIYDRSPVPENLGVDAFGLHFDNPIGLAAGFDKQGQAINGCLDLGFGFVEVGTVTPNPQSGGPKPRHFRLDADEGMVHRYEHNSWGADNVAFNIHSFLYGVDNARVPLDRRGIVGVNLGPNSHTPPPFMAEDYSRGVAKVGEYAKYLVLSVPASGSPALASPAAVDEHLRQIVRAAMAARARLPANTLMHPVDEQELAARTADMKKTPSLPALRALERLGRPPVLLKVDPDADAGVRAALAKVALEEGVDGLVVANATVSRPDTLKSVEKIQGGWLSGRPMRDLSTQAVADMYMLTQGKVPIIGVGGIFDAEDAFEKVRAGATLVQLHSALPFRGPTVARDIRDGLSLKLEQHGFKNIKDAVGVDADIWSDVPPNKR